jgi:chromosome segregation ATPase
MSVRESEAVRQHIDSLQHQVNELKESVEQARRETSQQVTARVEQVKAALSRRAESASDDAGQAVGQSQNQWQAMKADLAAKMRDLHDRIERKRGEVKADVADDDAMYAEGAAVDALDYASWTVWQAELTVLDAIDARARADERAAASR